MASKRHIISLLTCLVCVSYQLYKASAKEMIKNSRAIDISISKTVPQSGHLSRFTHTPQINALLSAFFTGPRVCTVLRGGGCICIEKAGTVLVR